MTLDVKTLCLGVLTEGEASGYDIKKQFEQVFSYFYVASFGSIYPALTQLAQEGLVVCREESQPNRPDRKVYALTDAGRERLIKALQSTPPRHRIRSEFYALLHFAHLLPVKRVQELLDERIADVNRTIEEIESMQARFKDEDCPLEPAQRFEIGLALHTLRAHRDFIQDNARALLREARAQAETATSADIQYTGTSP